MIRDFLSHAKLGSMDHYQTRILHLRPGSLNGAQRFKKKKNETK
jgi:hypothetical protein